jgi:hypothetical protein
LQLCGVVLRACSSTALLLNAFACMTGEVEDEEELSQEESTYKKQAGGAAAAWA